MDHPVNFRTIYSTFKWARVFLRKLAEKYGSDTICHQLASWKWLMSTCFSGIGCAEMAWGLVQDSSKRPKYSIIRSSPSQHWQLQLVVTAMTWQSYLGLAQSTECCKSFPARSLAWFCVGPSWNGHHKIQLWNWYCLQEGVDKNLWSCNKWTTLCVCKYLGDPAG